MDIKNKIRVFVLGIGDLIVLFLSLVATVYFRYRSDFYTQFLNHLPDFSVIFVIWISIFYIAGLYDVRRLRNDIDFFKTLYLAIFVNTIVAIIFFYTMAATSNSISPKTNLLIFVITFAIFEFFWRRFWNNHISRGNFSKVLLIGGSRKAEEIFEFIHNNPQLGYEIKIWLKSGFENSQLNDVEKIIRENNINLIVIPQKTDGQSLDAFYELLKRNVQIYDIVSFYSIIFKKVPLDEIEKTWFLRNIANQNKFYDELKRGIEILGALILLFTLLPFMILIALVIKLTSRGPVFYKQKRVGKNNEEFVLYKFRTMKTDAEKNGAQWAQINDERVTLVGRFLRYSHLDELPQLWNIIKGNLSFVGPRPERPEFVILLQKEIPHYDIRHLILPGITGWAQINYRYGSSIEDAKEKLQYDIYYLINRSLILDCAIIIKTIKSFFVNQK